VIAALAFVLFIAAVCVGVWLMLRSDTNEPDTIRSLALDRALAKFSRRMPELLTAMERVTVSMRQVTAAFEAFSKAFGS
jgi:hypothetical protein